MINDVSYKQLGYSDYMEKPILGKSNRLSPLQIKTMFPMGSINFDQASGGTLTVGGKEDAGGVISVLDSDASEKVLIDSSGITITGGKITIQDALGSTIIDSVGLVSDTSFTFDSVQGASGAQTESSTVWTDITGVTLDFSLTRAAHILFLYQTSGFAAKDSDNTAGIAVQVRLVLDAGSVGTIMELQGFRYMVNWGDAWATGYGQSSMMHYSQEVATGDHTVKVQFRTSANTYDAHVWKQYTRLSYLILGK